MLLVELFKSSYPIDDYSYQDYRCTAYFKDAEDKRVSVVFTPLDETIHDEIAAAGASCYPIYTPREYWNDRASSTH